MIHLLILLLIICLGPAVFHYYTWYNRRGRLVNQIPGPPAVPLLGNLLLLYAPLGKINDLFRGWCKNYHPVFRFWFGTRPTIHIHHPDDMEVVLSSTKCINKKFVYNNLEPWLKLGLLTSSESAMGVALDGEIDKEISANYRKSVDKMSGIVLYRLLRPYIYDWMLPFFPKINNRIRNVLGNLHGFTHKIVKERREYYERQIRHRESNDTNEDESLYQKKRMAMLDLLLSAEKDGLIDDEGIKEEVATFIFEGHDTTAMAMCFSILLFAENEEAQNRARIEVEEILSFKDGNLETSDLQNMTYLECCIKESLRLFPSVPSVSRHVLEDIQLKHCLVPKGAEILLNFIDTHRHSEFWPDPDKFEPDRFLPERVRSRHPFSYLPFSAGPRNCIGQKFAMMELKSLMARVLYNFRLQAIDRTSDIKIQANFVLRPCRPVRAKFIRIDR
uniref:Cytochrome P450 n=1 Tax=Trichogramma kaykai TaxID=54128 RepID=A0ABD2W8B6_9HYME